MCLLGTVLERSGEKPLRGSVFHSYATEFHPLTLSRPGTEKGDFISVSHTRTYSVLTSQCYTGSLSDQAKWAQGSIESNLNARR